MPYARRIIQSDMKKSFTLRLADEDRKKLAKLARPNKTTTSEDFRERIKAIFKQQHSNHIPKHQLF